MFVVLDVIPDLVIFKIDVSHTGRILSRGWIRLAISNTTSWELLELHYILSERASFVRENIMNHSKFFV